MDQEYDSVLIYTHNDTLSLSPAVIILIGTSRVKLESKRRVLGEAVDGAAVEETFKMSRSGRMEGVSAHGGGGKGEKSPRIFASEPLTPPLPTVSLTRPPLSTSPLT